MTRILVDKETGEEFRSYHEDCLSIHVSKIPIDKREPEPREFEEVDSIINSHGNWTDVATSKVLARAIVAEALRQADKRYVKI